MDWSDFAAVLAAVQRDGDALRYTAEPLQADHAIVLAAVQQNGYALRLAAEPLRARAHGSWRSLPVFSRARAA